MYYEVALKKPSYEDDNDWGFYQDNILDEIIIPKEKEILFTAENSEYLELCKNCECDSLSHPANENGRKWCIVLLHDLIKPDWKIKDLV